MVEVVLLHWLYKLLNGLCMTHVLARIACAAAILFGWSIWNANQSAENRVAFERDLALQQAEVRGQLELIEAMKPRRDLSQPPEPDEGY